MREIKFRAWDSHNKIMHEWKYLKTWTFKDIESQKDCLTVMQYTGLKDKNGKEIYEGDILRGVFEKENFEVKFYNGRWVDVHHTDYGSHVYVDLYEDGAVLKYKEIIGNVHSNPELL